jgi:hypothetical protein
MARRQAGPIAGLIVGSLLLVGGFFLTYRIGKPIRDKATASVAWPATEGRITASRVERVKHGGGGKATYTAEITYEYALDGQTFEGDRVWFGDDYSASDASVFRAAVGRYPAGKAVKVHYDPAEPAESVLEPGSTWSGSALYLIGLGLMTLGGMILVSAAGTLLLVTAALAAAVGGIFGGRRDAAPEFEGRRDDPVSDFDRPAPRPLGGRPPAAPPADDDGIEIV